MNKRKCTNQRKENSKDLSIKDQQCREMVLENISFSGLITANSPKTIPVKISGRYARTHRHTHTHTHTL